MFAQSGVGLSQMKTTVTQKNYLCLMGLTD